MISVTLILDVDSKSLIVKEKGLVLSRIMKVCVLVYSCILDLRAICVKTMTMVIKIMPNNVPA